MCIFSSARPPSVPSGERGREGDPTRGVAEVARPCTFLGPSRKRGPPKGYIDAIEARLHQTEALIGILLSSRDQRAKEVLEDLAERLVSAGRLSQGTYPTYALCAPTGRQAHRAPSPTPLYLSSKGHVLTVCVRLYQDPLAKEIITRVDNSPYGYKGRSRGAEAPTTRTRTTAPPEQREGDGNAVHATHPSNEWQDRVIERLNERAAIRNTLLPEDQVVSGPRAAPPPPPTAQTDENPDAEDGTESGYSDAASPISANSSLGPRRRRVPTLLLLAMFSLAARYSSRTADMSPPEDGTMWTAGDEYMEDAKVILDRTYAASRPSTCQALLLLGYREVGIGAMAQAWLYVGMAVRMAQDLGLHKSAEKWTAALGRSLFSKAELQERRRIWYGQICQSIYAIKPATSRPAELARLDSLLTKWSLELPEHLRFDPAAPKLPPPPPHVLTLHMQYWCTVLLLHRPLCVSYRPPVCLTAQLIDRKPLPSIRLIQDSEKPMSPSASSVKEAEIRANSRRHYNICVQAANHITFIVSVYGEYYIPSRASVFPCYYVFTAGIMHVATRTCALLSSFAASC
ncbi:hypothetical protein BN946_scf184910.g20 [Trametes cinnabarina]|uniref:Xylanolytic transcriptional activator regulatory domain-containing protein n=1 Tax=Pycnoporus cinnabarinus TaxID=5643 RepID=A0A060SBB6_PYCCI|nr:hypothetical protein BN946_scf184910.g20 [Trametes cinnabarina]